MINHDDVCRIFTAAVQAAYDQEQVFLDKLAEVEYLCNESGVKMHISCRINNPTQLSVDYVGSPAGILAQGTINVGLSKRQDGTTTLSISGQEDLSADQTAEDILRGFLQGIAQQEALNGAYKAVCSHHKMR